MSDTQAPKEFLHIKCVRWQTLNFIIFLFRSRRMRACMIVNCREFPEVNNKSLGV